MKILFYFMVIALCSCGRSVISDNLNAADTASNSNTNISLSGLNTAANESNSNANEDRDSTKLDFNSRSFRVDTYEDNKLISRSFFKKGRLEKEITYNVETNSEEFVTQYYYKKDGDFDRLKVTKGGGQIVDELFSESMRDFETHREILEAQNIKLPLAPEILSKEVDDLANVFSVADNYDDFKKETSVTGNQKRIKFTGFNKRIDFKHSSISLVVGNNPIHIKDYELTLENNFPTKESLKTDDGELTKTYSYKDEKLIGVVYQFTDLENRTNSLEKRFEYHKLDQKP